MQWDLLEDLIWEEMKAIVNETGKLVEVKENTTFSGVYDVVGDSFTKYESSQLTFVSDDYQPDDKPARFDAIVKRMADTYRAKNADYGDSFGQSVKEFGYTAALVRMSDKFNRLKNLMRADAQAQVKDESIKDTILDLACYSVMLAIEVEKREK